MARPRFRVGIVGLAHESNTFLDRPTTLADFERDTVVAGAAAIRERYADSWHEIGGFLEALDAEPDVEAVPAFSARALPLGAIEDDALAVLLERMDEALDAAGPLDAVLAAPHGAAVARSEPDVDGFWLERLRARFGSGVPIVATLDPHGNLSPRMARACDALVAYRTNPHLDQRARGGQAARIAVRALRGEIVPRMAAAFLPMCVNIERQATAEAHFRVLNAEAEALESMYGVLSISLMLGFPYADVPEMGAAVIAVADSDPAEAEAAARGLAQLWWHRRDDFRPVLISPAAAVERALSPDVPGPVCLLDMGDNVGGGSAGDGTVLARALVDAGAGPSVVSLADPEFVARAAALGPGASLEFPLGGKTDDRHGSPIVGVFRVEAVADGRFTESEPRHGGYTGFDMGPTVVVSGPGDAPVRFVVTTRRVAPFSLGQLTSVGVDPRAARILVAKGVHAPVAAYREVCPTLVRVNTPGATSADPSAFQYQRRRVPLWPFEEPPTLENDEFPEIPLVGGHVRADSSPTHGRPGP